MIHQFDELATADYITADKLSTWSMATGIAGIVVAPGIAHMIAVITGALALQRAGRLQTPQVAMIKSKARTGLILGIFGLVCIFLGLITVFGVFGLSFGMLALLRGAA